MTPLGCQRDLQVSIFQKEQGGKLKSLGRAFRFYTIRDFPIDQVNLSERVVPDPRAGRLHTALSNMLTEALPLASIFRFFPTGSK